MDDFVRVWYNEQVRTSTIGGTMREDNEICRVCGKEYSNRLEHSRVFGCRMSGELSIADSYEQTLRERVARADEFADPYELTRDRFARAE